MRMATLGFLILIHTGCREAGQPAPPNIRLGETACIECGMIVSDNRFGTASVIEGDRGSDAVIFDDFNCQLIFEAKHPDLRIAARWSRDYETLEWLDTSEAWFVYSSKIFTPMASHLAAFKDHADADRVAVDLDGIVQDFNECIISISSEP